MGVENFAKATEIEKFYFAEPGQIWSDKLPRFVIECDEASNSAVIRRLEQRFDHIYIDEVQDLVGYDLEIIELLLKSKINVTMVGHHRQATFQFAPPLRTAPTRRSR